MMLDMSEFQAVKELKLLIFLLICSGFKLAYWL